VSFVFELLVDDLTEEQGCAIETRTRSAWPVEFKRLRRFPWVGRRENELWIHESLRDGRDLLTDEAEPDAPAWDMHGAHLPAFADSLRILGEELPQGFAFRAMWTGSPVRDERTLTAAELAEVALASRLNEFTLYRVPATRAG
jgi:hypothetical protein